MSAFARIITNPWPFILLWWLGGLLTLFVPRGKWNNAKSGYYNYAGKYVEYEQQQRAYEEGQNGNYNGQNGQQQGAYGLFNCKWWQYKCRQQQYAYQRMMNGGGGEQQVQSTPSWYQFLGGINEEEDREARERAGISTDSPRGAVKFVYTWSNLILVALLVYGTIVLFKRGTVKTLALSLAFITQYSLLILILLPQGVITTDDRDLEDSVYCWYGQMTVLKVYFY
jgi:hypothetical protein